MYGVIPQIEPKLEILSTNKMLSGSQIELLYTCTSTLSIGADGKARSATANIPVTYKDECLDTLINPVEMQDNSIYLFKYGFVKFTEASTGDQCGTITNSIEYPDGNPAGGL